MQYSHISHQTGAEFMALSAQTIAFTNLLRHAREAHIM